VPFVHKILRYTPVQYAQQISKADDVVYEYGALALRHMRGDNYNTLNVFGQMLAASDSQEKALLTDDDVREEAKNFIIAGSDTTAVTLTYLVWAEIAQLSDALDIAELETAPILNSVIQETLRIHGAAPSSLPRVVPSQGMVVAGHHIPGGVEVSTQAYTTHRDPSIWSDPLR
jgi:cytochrome P450